MQNEILKPVLETDETAIPRYDIVNPDGSVAQQNVELRLKNEVMQQGTPYDEESVLPAQLATQLGLPTTATPAQALQLIATKSYNKAETLSNETKTKFGLGPDAVPDDAFQMALNMIPSPYGLLVVRSKNSSGNSVTVGFSITPSANTISSGVTNENGLFSVYAEPGNYSVTVDTGIFVSSEVPTKTATVSSGNITLLDFTADPVEHGSVDITESCSIVVPASITSVDLFGVGGGGSGAATAVGSTHKAASGGGAGGKTATLLSTNVAGKTLDIVIGAGGESVSDKFPDYSNDNSSGVNGKSGGDTSISVDGVAILTASGGTYGYASTNGGSTVTVKGGSGGSGGGAAKPEYASSTVAGNGGSDGGNGYTDGGTTSDSYAGTGQGTTTRAFGESSGELFSGGGGAAARISNKQAKGVGGNGGGGNGGVFAGPSSASEVGKLLKAGSGTTYGAGGGGAIGVHDDEDYSAVTVNSGDGYQGLVRIRW